MQNLKRKRIRLSNGAYRKLALQVLKRDGNTCQHCGCYTESPPHHVIYRSQGGSDVMENLVTLCWRDHRLLHDGKIKFEAVNDHSGED